MLYLVHGHIFDVNDYLYDSDKYSLSSFDCETTAENLGNLVAAVLDGYDEDVYYLSFENDFIYINLSNLTSLIDFFK